MYSYRATTVRVVDGDTAVLDFDLGFYVHRIETVRLMGINAPEPHTDTRVAGGAATEHLEQLILGKPLVVKTFKDRREKYGRMLADIFVDETHVNQQMIADGHAVEEQY